MTPMLLLLLLLATAMCWQIIIKNIRAHEGETLNSLQSIASRYRMYIEKEEGGREEGERDRESRIEEIDR